METSSRIGRTAGDTSLPSPDRATRALRALLGFDATTCLLLGASLVVATAAAARVTGLPPGLLLETGLFLLGFGGCVAWTASRRIVSHGAVLGIVAANAVWAVAGLVFAIDFMGGATAIGRFLVVAQGVAVAAIGLAESVALRRATGEAHRS